MSGIRQRRLAAGKRILFPNIGRRFEQLTDGADDRPSNGRRPQPIPLVQPPAPSSTVVPSPRVFTGTVTDEALSSRARIQRAPVVRAPVVRAPVTPGSNTTTVLGGERPTVIPSVPTAEAEDGSRGGSETAQRRLNRLPDPNDPRLLEEFRRRRLAKRLSGTRLGTILSDRLRSTAGIARVRS